MKSASKYLPKAKSEALTIPRREAVCLVLLVLLTVGWFTGGREPIALLFNAILTVILFGYWLLSGPKKSSVAALPLILRIGLIGLVAVVCASWIWSINRYATVIMMLSFVSAAAIFIVARDVLADKTARQFWQVLFLTGAAVLAVLGLYYFFAGNYDRVISLFYWPNPLAAYLGVATILALFGYKNGGHKAYFALAVLFLATTILTFSRAGWLCLLLAVIFVIATAKDKKLWAKNVLLCLIVAAVLASGLALLRNKVFHHGNVNLSARVSEIGGSANTSTSDRVNYWRGARDIYADHMWLGVGAGGFASIYPRYQRQVVSATSDPHNFYLQVLSELGLLGFVFLAMIVIGLIQLLVTAVKEGDETKLIYGAALGLMLLHAGLDFDFRYPTMVFLAAVLMAIFTTGPVKKQRPQQMWVKITQIALLVGLLGLVYVAIINFRVENTHENLDASLAPMLSKDDMQAGYTTIEQAKLRNPNYLADAGAFYYMLAANDKSGKTSFDTAERLARAGIAADRYNARHYYLLANVFLARHQTDAAIDYFKKSIELDPLNNPQYYAQLADVYIQKGQLPEARQLIDSITKLYTDKVITNRSGVVQLKSRLAVLYNQKAIIEYREGNKDAAAEAVARALQLAPNYQDAKDLSAKIQAEK